MAEFVLNRSRGRLSSMIVLVLLAAMLTANAEPLAGPGDMRLRHDLQLLNDSGVINVTLSAWPLALGDLHSALASADSDLLNSGQREAYVRLRNYLSLELETGVSEFRLGVSAAANPRIIRTFEDTPREDGQLTAGFSWLGERLSVNLSATYTVNPVDGDEIRPDGSYVGVALGNWIVTAGWQDRWWGPSRDGSLILSSNARPTPGIAVQRNVSAPFDAKWLKWIGPWTLTSFMTELDDDRVINNAWLFGVRGSFRPPKTGLEIGISRTAQWCGDGRPCEGGTFVNLLLGNDNQGVNVDPEDEPGNQLGGFDIRWTLPKRIPVAVYMQWIGEDGRGGGGAIGSWMRQVGAEYWGAFGTFSHRTHFEVSDTTCRQGGFGFSERVPNCAYEHSIYRTGFRYQGRVIGHAADGDSLSYSVGSTLVQSTGHSWSILLRHIKINEYGAPSIRHTLSSSPQELTDLQISHERQTGYGRFHAGLGYSRLDRYATNSSNSDINGFVQWSLP